MECWLSHENMGGGSWQEGGVTRPGCWLSHGECRESHMTKRNIAKQTGSLCSCLLTQGQPTVNISVKLSLLFIFSSFISLTATSSSEGIVH